MRISREKKKRRISKPGLLMQFHRAGVPVVTPGLSEPHIYLPFMEESYKKEKKFSKMLVGLSPELRL